MIISDVNLSYPFLKYNIEVSHFTSRKSTVIEWLILEAINKVSSLEEFADIPISVLFEQIFTISDCNLLIKPCLLSLQDLGAIILDGIDDETELENVPMRNLSLTETGLKMQKEGLLPGVTSEDRLVMHYDISEEKLADVMSYMYKDEPNGIQVQEVLDEDDYIFPAMEVRQLIDEWKSGERKSGKPSWLMQTTTINEINPIYTEICWKNVVKKFCVTDKLHCYVDGVDDDEINTNVLLNIDLAEGPEYEELPLLNIENPDVELKSMFPATEIKDRLQDYIKKDSFSLVDEKYFTNNNVPQNNKEKTNIIVFGSSELTLNFGKQKNIIKIPDTILYDNIVYQNKDINFSVCNLELKTKLDSRVGAFACVRENKENSFSETIIDIVDRYYIQDNKMIFLLKEADLNELYYRYIDKIILEQNSMKNKAEAIENINKNSVQVYNKLAIATNQMETLLFENSEWNEKYLMQEVYDVIAECNDITLFKQNNNIFEVLFKKLFPLINDDLSLAIVWEFLKKIQMLHKRFVKLINNDGLYQNIYTEPVITQLLDMLLSENLFENEEYTFVEQIVFEMRRIIEGLHSIFPEFDISKVHSQEFFMEQIVNNKGNLPALRDCVMRWIDEVERFNTRIGDYSYYLQENGQLFNINENINKLLEVIKLFFDDSSVKYQRIVVVDTCALMHEPDLISWFENNKAMLIVPQIVLSELDKLKESDDETEAYAARDAIRQINNYAAYEWLNIKEESCPELLSKDLDENSNDNKILSIAVKYIIKEPILITDDINLKNIATSQSVKSMNVNAYKNMIENEALSVVSSKKSKKDKKKKKK